MRIPPMLRCPDCGTTCDNLTELAHHECEPTHPAPEDVKRVRAVVKRRSAEEQAAMLTRAELEFDWR